jgi:glutamate racemase
MHPTLLNPAAPIGVFDSGVGGLSVLCAARAELPRENFFYLADSGFAPYGDEPDAYVIERSERIGAWFVAQGAKAIVVACNTATAIAVQSMRKKFDLPIVGVEPGLKPAVAVTKSGRIGILATAATLASQRFADLFARVQADSPGIEFFPTVGRGWVELVELGELSSAVANQLVANSVAPLVERGCDTFVLGCTHYPFLTDAIRQAAPGVAIIDTAPAIARQLARRLIDSARCNSGADVGHNGKLRIFTSGDALKVGSVTDVMLAKPNVEAPVSQVFP